MDKLNKKFIHGQVLRTEEMQAIVDKIDELVESGGGGGNEIELSEEEWAVLTNNDTDYSRVVEGVKYFIYESESPGGGGGTSERASYDEETGLLTVPGLYNVDDSTLVVGGSFDVESGRIEV